MSLYFISREAVRRLNGAQYITLHRSLSSEIINYLKYIPLKYINITPSYKDRTLEKYVPISPSLTTPLFSAKSYDVRINDICREIIRGSSSKILI